MPLPAGFLARLASAGGTAGKITGVAGSLADYASLAFTVADHLKAQEGLKYNSHAFSLSRPVSATPATPTAPAKQPASATSPGQSRGTSAATAPSQPQQPRFIGKQPMPLLTIRGSDALADFGIELYFLQDPAGTQNVLFVVHLDEIQGFATEIGDQAEVEFSGQAVDGGYLLSAKGIVNELFSGFFHFWCDYLVQVPPDRRALPRVRPLNYQLSGQGGTITQSERDFEINF